jgi:hypothetical protein
VNTWLVVAVVVAVLAAAFLAVLVRRRIRSRRLDGAEQQPAGDLGTAVAADGRPPDRDGKAPNPAAPEPTIAPPTDRHESSDHASGPGQTGIEEMPTSPVGHPTVGPAAHADPGDEEEHTVRLPVRSSGPSSGRAPSTDPSEPIESAPSIDPSEPIDPAEPTHILPVIGGPRADGTEPNRHARPDDEDIPASATSTSGGGRHRAPSESTGLANGERIPTRQRAEPHGGPAIPSARRPDPAPTEPQGTQPPTEPPSAQPPTEPPSAQPPTEPQASQPPAVPQQDPGPPPSSPEALPRRRTARADALLTQGPIQPSHNPGPVGWDLFGEPIPTDPGLGNGDSGTVDEEDGQPPAARIDADRLLGRHR